MQQAVGETGRGLERVAEGMAEIEQRPLADFALVAADDRGLHAAAHRDGVLARAAACEQLPPIRLQPGEEASIPDQAVFDDFGIARAELAWRQRVEQRGVGQDQHRLMEGADEVLAVIGIDGGLAADRGIDLRKQRGWHLHIVETTADNRGGEAGKIADHAATERHHDIGAFDARGNQRFAHSLEHREALRSLARRHRHRRGTDAGGSERGLGRGEVVTRDRFVGDDRGLGARPQRGNFLAQRGQLTAPDNDLVAALAEHHIDDGWMAGAQRRSHGRRSPSDGCPAPAQATRICPASPLTISSTILSCSTSRDCTVRSAKA